MLTEIYIEALLIDEELADQVWEAWDARETDGFNGILSLADPGCPICVGQTWPCLL